MKPILAASGTGNAKNGMRASIIPVKKDFGPGESIVLRWSITNEGDAPREIQISRELYEFSFVLKTDGKVIKSVIPDRIRRHTAEVKTIDPGQTYSKCLDLRSIDWEDKSWLDKFGAFEVSVALGEIQSGSINFKVTAPGESRPPIAPELAEKLRTLIAQLGDNEFATREQAYSRIREIGKPAIVMLEETVAAGKDAEVVSRCKKLIEEIQRGVIAPPVPAPQPKPVIRPPALPVPQPKPLPPAVKPPRPPDDLEF
jgi:hypothetical protein